MIRLNLLPPEIKEQRVFAKINAELREVLLRISACLVLSIAVIGVVYYIVYTNLNIAEEGKIVAEAQLASWDTVEEDATDFSARLSLIDKLQDSEINWQNIFTELANSTPANVKLASYDFNKNSTTRVSLTGYAVTSSDVGSFRELLAQSELFEYVDIESMVAATDPTDSNREVLSFKITLALNLTEAKK